MTKLHQIIREELKQSAAAGAEQLRLADLSLDDLKQTARGPSGDVMMTVLQSVYGVYIPIPLPSDPTGQFEHWRDEWLEKDPNAVLTLQDNVYVVDPDLKIRFGQESQRLAAMQRN